MTSPAAPIRIGLISDTHGRLRPEVFDIFSNVDQILHAGDVGDPDILIELGAIAPVTAVWGNVDYDLRSSLPEVARLEIGGMAVALIHGHQLRRAVGKDAVERLTGAELVLFGHSHQPGIERIGEVLAVNPGSAGPRRFGLPVTVGIAVVDQGSATVELIDVVR